MILRISYEEATAVNSAAERVLSSAGGVAVLAPPEVMESLEVLLPIPGDISVNTLARQERLLGAVEYVLDHLKRRMDAFILEQYVGSDDSVNAYFDYANVLTVREKLVHAGREMRAMIEVMTGESPDPDTARTIEFPD
ncbi:MAG TPA: hypothetical protein VK966_07835 [Longimicrobiales bacterium]|nr:hypothetical protein [Longimicrobiales bacterium]